jgi:saccharopine dehydrogenase-like NADP-dependent oxidoreductase
VDASGPFQIYHDPYRVVRAALARRIGYLDLADGADFVQGIAQFDAQARERGVFVLGGASSFPVLTAAVVRRLARGMTRVDAVSAGIAPSPFAGLGLNVIRRSQAIAASRSNCCATAAKSRVSA